MAFTSAERQRRYRQKRNKDPQRRKEFLEKEKLKYIPISRRPLSIQLKRRTTWRNAQRKVASKKRYETDEIYKTSLTFHFTVTNRNNLARCVLWSYIGFYVHEHVMTLVRFVKPY